MEICALQKLNPKAVSYYVSATDDETTKAENSNIYQSILLRPPCF